jgi:hypothetical protein
MKTVSLAELQARFLNKKVCLTETKNGINKKTVGVCHEITELTSEENSFNFSLIIPPTKELYRLIVVEEITATSIEGTIDPNRNIKRKVELV